MSTLAPGQSVGRYKIVRFLGAGAMGEVYLADDPQIDRKLAIKTVRLAGRESDVEDRKRRLLREARAAGRMLHPNIVTLFDAGEAEGLLYLAFEFVEGRDLASRMDAPERLTLREVLRIGRSVAAALEFAHRQGIVHRDIKPGNILLDAQGGVKVADFGIAKVAGQETELTMAGSVLGSPQYLSPEQIRGEDLDGRSDLFSLGVVLYEILSHKRPFVGDTLTSLCYSILTKEPPPLSDLRAVPERLEGLVGRMLAKDRAERIGTAAEVVRELSAIELELAEETLLSPAGGEVAKTTVLPRRATTGSGVSLPPPPPPPPLPPSPSTKMTVPPASQAPSMPPVPASAVAPVALPVATPTPPRAALPGRPVRPGSGGGSRALIAAGALAFLMVVGGAGGWIVARRLGWFGAGQEGEKPGEATPPSASPAPGASTPAGPAAAEPSASAPASGEETPPAGALTAQPAPRPSTVPKSTVAPPATAPSGPIRVPQPGERPALEVKGSSPAVVPPAERLPEPEPEPLRPAPAPAPEEERPKPSRSPAERTVASGLQATFQVDPPDAQLLLDRISLGSASEWTGKKGGQPYTFPGADTYRLRVKKDGMRTAEIDVVVSERGGVTPISVRLRPLAGAGAEAQELATVRTGEAVSFKVRPASASFAVDGVPKGPVQRYTGGIGRSGWLSLPAGRHRISITAPGYQQQDVIVDVTGSESDDRVPIVLTLVSGG